MESPTQPLSQLNESATVGISQDFLEITARKTIEALKDCKEESSYVVLATVKHIIDDDDWWYTACICNKAVYKM
ncbi:hypothetical protein EI013_25160 [Escherichia coli]|nr:hypothetical protein [Escherichia coli]